MLTGALLFLSVFIAASNVATVLYSWYTASGRFWSAVSDTNLHPVLAISVIMMVAGLSVLSWGLFHRTDT